MKTPLAITVAMIAATICSCRSVGVADQEVLTRPGIAFETKGARDLQFGLVSMVERGRASDTVTSGAICAGCR